MGLYREKPGPRKQVEAIYDADHATYITADLSDTGQPNGSISHIQEAEFNARYEPVPKRVRNRKKKAD